MRLTGNLLLVALLTIVTQLGGLAWLIALGFRRRFAAFLLAYAGLWLGAQGLAPHFGREPLPCGGEGPLRAQSWFYCLANRNYVVPELKAVAERLAADLEAAYPGSRLVALDAGFPFFAGFPLIPHLSHDDGRKLDLALFYAGEAGYEPGATRSPLGYFAFEQGPSDCPARLRDWRWDLDWLQPFLKDLKLEPERTRFLLRRLSSDERVRRVFLEPHLTARLGAASPKIRFQGCRAARHDDHIHIEI